MPDGNIRPPSVGEILSRQKAGLYERDRQLRPGTGRSSPTALADVNGNLNVGVLQDGHSYIFDETTGAARPSSPQLVPFSWPGIVTTGDKSGPHLVVLPNTSRIYMVTLAIGTVDPDDTIAVEFFLNGSMFTSLTLATSEVSTLARYEDSWPALGGNATDIIQVQCTEAGAVGADLVAAVRIV